MKQSFLYAFITLCLCASCGTKANEQSEKGGQKDSSKVTYVLIDNISGGYGYEIFDNGKKVITQPYMPGGAGKKAFTNKKDAAKVAGFVVKKIEQGEFPPGVSKTELDSLLAHCSIHVTRLLSHLNHNSPATRSPLAERN